MELAMIEPIYAYFDNEIVEVVSFIPGDYCGIEFNDGTSTMVPAELLISKE